MMRRARLPLGIVLAFCIAQGATAEWEKVLRQIQLPHHYYYREMYLPQVNGGPDAVDWSADGSAVVFSEAGYLWRQSLKSPVAEQLTDGAGYDFQPDVSPDGRRIVFVRESPEALELNLLDLATGAITPLTDGGAVNVEPRWSPDGGRLAWVSTRDNGRFQVYVGAMRAGKLEAQRLRVERRSSAPRYYYSEYDHEISPTWSPDGKELIFISNPETRYGTGGLWRAALAGGGAMRPVRIEETSWKARPDWSPGDGRVIYASYLGRQWHQLWVTTADGGDPFPLTYGDFDVTGARWSPDGRRIAYLSNESGANRLWIMDLSQGGARTPMRQKRRAYVRPHGRLELELLDGKGHRAPARVAVRDGNGRYFFGAGRWPQAADGFDRGNTRAAYRYFRADGSTHLDLPAGAYEVTVWRGLEHFILHQTVDVAAGGTTSARLQSQAVPLPRTWAAWDSGDLHVHMNYGGAYRNTPERLARQAAAEDLDLVFNLVVNKEQRIPDIGYFSTGPDLASTDRVLVLHGQEFHTTLWGHLGLLGLSDHFLIPDYSAYPNTAAASLAPGNGSVADIAHAQHALVGYVHPFDLVPDTAIDQPWSEKFPPAAPPLALPVDAALGKVDYYEVLGFSDHQASAEMWHRLLNCGFRISAGAGTDAMANYASLRGPVGLNRTYARLPDRGGDPEARRQQWLNALKAGHTFATNGPLLLFTVEGRGPGETVALEQRRRQLRYEGVFRSIVPIRHLQVVHNGVVASELETGADGMGSDFSGAIDVDGEGWILLRAYSDENAAEIFDRYPYATTTPVWLAAGDSAAGAGCDSAYFTAWLDRVRAMVEAHPDFNDGAERDRLLSDIDAARAVYGKPGSAAPRQ